MRGRILVYGVALLGLAGGAVAISRQDGVTYRKHIAPLFAAKCISCHYTGGPGPFRLQTYDDLRKRADLISTVVILRKMPPMDAKSSAGQIPLHSKLTDEETVLIQEWIRTGMQEGTGPVPQITTPSQDWRLGTPALVLKPKEAIEVPAEGPQAVVETVIDLPIQAEHDLVAFDVRAASPAAARQVLLSVSQPGDQSPFTPTGIQTKSLVGAWAIGYQAWKLPEHAGVRLKPGDRLRLRLLYHPTGKREDGSIELALYFSQKPRAVQPVWRTIGLDRFQIPGGEPYYTDLTAMATLENESQLVSVVPEARNIATFIQLRTKEGKELFGIDKWDRRWTGAYNFPKPLPLPAGSILIAEFQYKNSNHKDPSLTLDEIKRLPPNPTVGFGPGEDDELFWMHVQLVPNP